MNECWPPCSPYCECVDGDCRPSTIQINAVRFRTADGRHLVAAGGGGAGLFASNGGTPQSQTFRFMPPAEWPFASGDPIALVVCDSTWNASANWVRVYHTGVRTGASVSYVLGGEDGGVFVNAGFSAGINGYSGDDPQEKEFSIIKSGGGAINDGDTVFIGIAQNTADFGPFFFRVSGSGQVEGDGTDPAVSGAGAAAAAATPFIVEFHEVKGNNVGPRPTRVLCRRCATVSVIVSDARNRSPLPRANVWATGSLSNDPFKLTARALNGGQFTFAYRTRSGIREICVPEGEIVLSVTEGRHESFSGLVTVPAAGSITVPVELNCTKVSGKLLYANGAPVIGGRVVLTDSDGQEYATFVDAEGSFEFDCVKQGPVSVEDPDHNVMASFDVTPSGTRNVILTVPAGFAAIEGNARDPQGRTIEAVTIKARLVGSSSPLFQTSTDPSGHYEIQTVAPDGSYRVFASKAGYVQNPILPPITMVMAPGTTKQDVQLHPTVVEIWNTGVDVMQAPLAPGGLDPHWYVVDGPGIAAKQSAVVLSSPPGAYYTPTDSGWIWINANGLGSGSGDEFTFQMQFDLTGFDPATVIITGAWGVDNNGTILLNGSIPPAGSGTFSMLGDAVSSFASEHAFTISGGFQGQLNRLEVRVGNFGAASANNPAGLNVTKLKITGTPL